MTVMTEQRRKSARTRRRSKRRGAVFQFTPTDSNHYTVTLNVGPRAAWRDPGQMDSDATVLIEHAAGVAGNETIL